MFAYVRKITYLSVATPPSLSENTIWKRTTEGRAAVATSPKPI